MTFQSMLSLAVNFGFLIQRKLRASDSVRFPASIIESLFRRID